MNMQTNMNFDFMEQEVTNSKYHGDTAIGISSIIILIVLAFFVLIPEKNIEKSGKEIERFQQVMNPVWVDETTIKGYSLTERNQEAQNLINSNNMEGKMKFIMTVHSILMEEKTNPFREHYLSQVMKNRQDILKFFMEEFKINKQTSFNCHFADCKEKEYKVTQEKLQIIKLMNLKLNHYYLDLINRYERSPKNKNDSEEINFKVMPALTPSENKIYNEMK